MAMRHWNPIWEIDPEYVKTLPVMDFWRDIHGNIIDFEAEKAKGNTGFLYEIDRPNTQLYDGSKQIDDEVGRYRGSGACCIIYDDRYGTNGIKRTVLEFHSGTREELYEAEGKLLKELGVVEDDRYLNKTDETLLSRINTNEVLSSFGEIIAIGLDGAHYQFENEEHAADELSRIFNRKVTLRTIGKYLKGTCLSYRKYLLDIRPAGMSVVDEVLLEQKREETEEKNKITSIKISEANRKSWEKPEVKEKRSKKIKEAKSDPEWKKNFSETCKEAQNRPEVKEKQRKAQKEAQNRPEVAAKKSESMKKTCQKPEVRAQRSKIQKEVQNRPDMKKRRVEKQKETNKTPETIAKRKKAQKEVRSRPEFKEKRKELAEAQKIEGILVFQDENKSDLKFKGVDDGAGKAGVEKSKFRNWIYGGIKTFKKHGIKKITYGKKVIE